MPQLLLSVWRSRHVPAQTEVPVAQVTVQVPREQTVPDGHTLPQRPQLLTSVETSRHTPEQLVVPAPHDTAHTPEEHT